MRFSIREEAGLRRTWVFRHLARFGEAAETAQALEWCEDQFGGESSATWQYAWHMQGGMVFIFRREDIAMAFKLRWYD